jgi:hypothetical protein
MAGMIYWVEPELIKDILLPGLYLPFFMLFFPAVFLTTAVLFNNSHRGLLLALGLSGVLILKLHQLANLLNLLLILGILVAVDRYWES